MFCHVSCSCVGGEGVEITVHRHVWQKNFNVGERVVRRCKEKALIDARAGASGRKPFTMLQTQIEQFWLNDVEKEPSHYNATSKKQHCVDVSSVSHGFLIFLAQNFNTKYQECVDAQFFPGLHKRPPEHLAPDQYPEMACDECIQAAEGKAYIACPHIPKFSFFQKVTRQFNLGFKRPGSDQCEECNSHHNKIVLYRAMGRHRVADAIEDRLQRHKDSLFDHHTRAQSFFSLRAELQHSSKSGSGRNLPTYIYDADVEWCSVDVIQSISMDAGSGLRTPFCRVGFAYFSRVLVTNVYHIIVDHGTRDPQPYHAYLWNDSIGGKGPSEIMSIFLDFIKKAKTGAKRLVVECDGCSGQVFNQFFFAMCASLVDPSSDLCRALGASAGSPIFERIDLVRGEVGHTFMVPDRVHGRIRVKCRSFQTIATIDEYAGIISGCCRGQFRVTRIKVGDGIFMDMKKYVEQSYKLGGAQMDIDNNPISTRRRHWVNFGVGPSGGENSTVSRHKYWA